MNKQLLFSVTKKDLDITYFSGTGAGGQYRNRHKNCVRIKHNDSGVMVTGQEQRNLKQNLNTAFKRLANNKDFRKWLKIKAAEVTGKDIKIKEQIKRKVDDMCKEENLKIEYYDPEEVNE